MLLKIAAVVIRPHMSKTRAIRLSPAEEAKIQKFLALNPFFDFSSLARLAILKFVENPELHITPLLPAKSRKNPNEGKSL